MAKVEGAFSGRSCGPLVLIVCALLLNSAALPAQTAGPLGEAHTSSSSTSLEDYQIGPGDIIIVGILEAPEFGGKFRISGTGELQIPALPKPLPVEGKTTLQLSQVIKQAFVDAQQLRNPTVSVYVDEYHGRTVTVMGTVAKPSVYPLQRRTTVLEALSMAGGLAVNAGNTVTVIRGRASAEATNTAVGSVETVDLGKLVKGKDPSANIEVRNGDEISIATGEVVYVVGAVTRPGGFVMQDPSSGVSVVQALALAEGFTSLAATHRALIIRQSISTTGRQVIPVDVAQLLSGQGADMRLAPNDILYVPQSGAKRSLKVAGDVAMAAVNGLATYGVGYRIGVGR